MGNQILERHFGQIGARVNTVTIPEPTWLNRLRPGIDIGTDKKGEFFDIKIRRDDDVNYEVIDIRKDLRHLLLLARRESGKEKYLCGHDERHWFVCAVPGRSITNVVTAMDALQPAIVREQVKSNIRRSKTRFDRRNEAFVRQGEWFFVPAPKIEPKGDNQIRRHEPLIRGFGSKAHVCAEAFRTRGEPVMVCTKFPTGVSMQKHSEMIQTNPKAKKWNWSLMYINASVYVRGTVRHPDHKTIVLDGWHQVFMNTESEAPWAPNVVFLD